MFCKIFHTLHRRNEHTGATLFWRAACAADCAKELTSVDFLWLFIYFSSTRFRSRFLVNIASFGAFVGKEWQTSELVYSCMPVSESQHLGTTSISHYLLWWAIAGTFFIWPLKWVGIVVWCSPRSLNHHNSVLQEILQVCVFFDHWARSSRKVSVFINCCLRMLLLTPSFSNVVNDEGTWESLSISECKLSHWF